MQQGRRASKFEHIKMRTLQTIGAVVFEKESLQLPDKHCCGILYSFFLLEIQNSRPPHPAPTF